MNVDFTCAGLVSTFDVVRSSPIGNVWDFTKVIPNIYYHYLKKFGYYYYPQQYEDVCKDDSRLHKNQIVKYIKDSSSQL